MEKRNVIEPSSLGFELGKWLIRYASISSLLGLG